MHHGHAAGIPHVLKIVVEGSQLINQHHALVDDGPAGQGAYIGVRILAFKQPTQDKKPPVKLLTGGNFLRPF